MARTRVKVCGIREDMGARAAVDSGADALGFVFVRSSPRYIAPEEAASLVAGLPALVSSVGVFMDQSAEAIGEVLETCPTTYTQLHGSEDEELAGEVGPYLIKAVRFDPATIERELERWEGVDDVDAILIDGPSAGSGEPFDWAVLSPVVRGLTKPLFLAGGLTPENVGDAVRAVRPFAVDVSSGVERERGVKDPALIARFCAAVRRADAG